MVPKMFEPLKFYRIRLNAPKRKLCTLPHVLHTQVGASCDFPRKERILVYLFKLCQHLFLRRHFPICTCGFLTKREIYKLDVVVIVDQAERHYFAAYSLSVQYCLLYTMDL